MNNTWNPLQTLGYPHELTQAHIPPVELVCHSYPIREIPPTSPSVSFYGSFVYACNALPTEFLGELGQPAQDQNLQTTLKREREAPPPQKQPTKKPKHSGFDYFTAQIQTDITSQLPDSTTNEVADEIKLQWKALSSSQQTEYQKMALENYFSDPNKKKKPKKTPGAPKRNMSAFLYFSNVSRAEVKKLNPGLSFSEIAKVLSNMWRCIAPEQKQEFLVRAREDKVRYFQEKKLFEDTTKQLAHSGQSQDNDEEMGANGLF